LKHNEDFEATPEAIHFFDALEDSSIDTAHHGVQSHAVGGEPESTLRGLVSCGKEEILSSHGADNTQPAKVISATMQGRNLVFLNLRGAPDFSRGVKFLDSQCGAEEVFQEQPDMAINPRMTLGTTIPITNNILLQSTNAVESIDSGEDADPRLSTPCSREDNKTDEVANPSFIATTGVGNMTGPCGDIDHIQPACADPEGLDTGEQTSRTNDTRSHTPTSSITPNADEGTHIYSIDASELLASYTPCQFHS
jgi:hypothetical protein